jgi:diguanylate cyclase (GGDEF)-like protein/PAS domain S-box-containing protein
MTTLRRIIYESLIMVMGVSIATIGLLALLGWILDMPILTTWQTNTLPISPSAALLSILFGAAFVFNAKRPSSRITFLMTTFCAWVGAMLALLLFTLRIFNSYSSVELLGLNITGMLGNAPIGFISPITALCFLLANLAFLITLPQGSHRLWRGYFSSILAGLLMLVSFTLLLSFFFGLPLPIINTLIRPALNTSFILLLMGMGLLIVAHLRIMFSDDESDVIEIDRLIYVLFFSALTASILITAFQSYRTTEIKFREGVELQLQAVSELKTRQLSQWRIERLGDGALAQSALINSAVRQHLQSTSILSTQGALQDWFERILHDSHYGYDRGFLLDAQGVVRMSIPTKVEPLASILKNSAMAALRTNQIIFQDFFRDEYDQKVYLALLVPIANELDSMHPLGVMVLRIDPSIYLYPFIKQWPTISTTAETLLVRRDGNEVLFLNDLRFTMDAALKKRIVVADNLNVPSVKAVLGQRGLVEGIDYNGKQVIAVLSNIADTPWLLVTKINNKEVYAPLDVSMKLTALLATSLIFAVGVAMFFLRRQHLREINLIELETRNAELRNQELHSSLLKTTMDGYFLIDSQGGLLEVNDTYCQMSGYTAQELLDMRVADLEVNDTDQDVIWHFQNAFIQDGNRYETRHHRKDGSVFNVEISMRLLSVNEEQFVVFVQDISQRKLAEEALKASQAHLDFALQKIVTGAWTLNLLDHTAQRTLLHDRIFGYQTFLPNWTYEMFLAHVLPEERQEVDRKFHDAIIAKTSWNFECRIRRADGDVRWIYAAGDFLQNAKGDTEWMSGIVQDITERKLAEDKLRLSSSVFAHAWEGILITTTDGTIVDVNDALSRITGYSRNEMLGKNPRIFSAGLQDRTFYAELWSSLIKKGHWYGEIWNRRKSGEMYAIIETISVVNDDQGIPRHYVAMLTDITQIKMHENELMHIAHYDPLTNLPNRILLADRMRQGITQVHRRNKSLAVIFVDLDGFKAINDNHGHEAGDRLLIAIAARMEKALREGDTFARIGGDEFVAVLLDLDAEDTAVPMLNRLLAAASEPVKLSDISLQVSASLGVAFYPQEQEVDADMLLRQADQAMYQAKVAGRNRYHVFDAVLDNNIRVRHESLDRIHAALIEQEFVLYYQPKVNMRTGVIVGAEALIRWNHPEKGLLAPGLFLPEIEDHPLAIALGEWVINSALSQLELWRSQGFSTHISVNVGARQLQQTDFVSHLQEILKAHPSIAPSYLEFEVLETSALEDITKISNLIEACQDLGMNFALDDFGTGYSSLTYLKLLPVTLLKIDQSFVRDILKDPDDLAIVEAVVGLGRTFRRQVIAEGVETIKHGTLLLEHGCELGQGYGIARPMPAEKLPEWTRTWRPNLAWAN